MKPLIRILLLPIVIILFTSCKDTFLRINTPPTSVTEINPALVFTSAERNMMYQNENNYWKINTMTYGAWVQHWGVWDYNFQPPHYIASQSWMDFDWQQNYTVLKNYNKIIDLLLKSADGNRDDPKIRSKLAQVKILKVLLAERTTATVGDIPYFNASEGSKGIYKPEFNKQQDLYPAFIDTLDKYIAKLHVGDLTFGDADLLYGGNIEKWKRFGNSLKLRIGMRVKYADPSFAQKVITEAMNSSLISSNAGSARIPTQAGGAPAQQINPILAIFRTPQGKPLLGKAFVRMLKTKNDPRLTLIAEPTARSKKLYAETGDPNDLVYRGIAPGLTAAQADTISVDKYSLPSSKIFVSENVARPIDVLMYSEVAFLKAEAALAGWGAVPSQAQAFYQDGIEADLSVFPYNVPQNTINDYIAREGTLSGTSEQKLEQIMDQKWIALFDQERQAYFEWRRTGYPQLDPGLAKGNTGGTIPRRGLYGQNEQIFNHENYQKVIERQGPDNLTTRMWIDPER